MKKLISIIMVMALLISCAACSSGGTNKSISYPIDSSPQTLDPQYASEMSAQIADLNIFEGLVRHDKEGKIIAGIAESWDISADGLVYTFKLKDDTEWYCTSSMKKEYGADFYDKFCNVKVSAYDFEYACQRCIDPSTASPLANRMMVIKGAEAVHSGEAQMSDFGVKATSSTSITFTLVSRCDDFLDRLTESEFMPCNSEFFEATNGRYGLNPVYILCNGPFYLSYWDPESGLTLKKNKYYSGSQEVIPSSVTLTIDNDPESVSTKISNGSLSAALLSPLSAVPEKSNVVKEIDNTVCGFIFNCSDSVTANESIRKALCMTIDNSLFSPVGDDMKKSTGLIPGSCLAGSDTYRNRIGDRTPGISYDEKSANRFWKWGLAELEKSSVSIKILCPEEFDLQVRNQIQLWQKLFGMELAVSVTVKTDSEIAQAISEGEFQMALGYVIADRQNASDFLAQFENGGTFGLNSTAYKNIVENTLKASKDDDMITGCLTAEDYLISRGAYYPLFSRSSKFVTGKDVGNISILNSESTVSFIDARRYD